MSGRLTRTLDDIILRLSKALPIRCPPGEHAHAGYEYCHPEKRRHRLASERLHRHHRTLMSLEQEMERLWQEMREMAARGDEPSPSMRADFSRLYRYFRQLRGGRKF